MTDPAHVYVMMAINPYQPNPGIPVVTSTYGEHWDGLRAIQLCHSRTLKDNPGLKYTLIPTCADMADPFVDPDLPENNVQQMPTSRLPIPLLSEHVHFT